MIKNLFSFLGYMPKEESAIKVTLLEAKLAKQNLLLEEQQTLILDLRSENIVLKDNQKVDEVKPIISYDIADPTPTDVAERKAYVVQVSVFFRNVLEKKLNQMIASALTLLSNTENDRELDVMIKGVIYSFKELQEWGKAMHNEEVAYAIPDGDNLEEPTLQDKLDNFEKQNG